LLLRSERHGTDDGTRPGFFSRLTAAFDRGFERLRDGYAKILTLLLRRQAIVPVVARADTRSRRKQCWTLVGRDFFPLIDGGQIQLHVRAPAGTRIEAPRRYSRRSRDKIREVIPDKDRGLIIDNIGLPARAYNLAFADGSTIGINDGIIQVQLKEGHKPTADYVRNCVRCCPPHFPKGTFYFQAADMVTQILNFGLPAQIDVRTVGYDKNNLSVARKTPSTPCRDSRHRRCASAAGSRRPGVLRPDRPDSCGSAWPQCEHGRHQHQCQPQLVGAGVAEFLDRSDFGNPVLYCRTDAGI